MSVPTNEQGHQGGYTAQLSPGGGRRYSVQSPLDWAPELQFPESVVVYDAMRTETHLAGVLEAVVQPLQSADWHLLTEGVPDNVVEFVRTELGLPSEDQPLADPEHQGVDIVEHLSEMAETMLWAGFSPAEMVYDIGDPTPAQVGLGAGVQGKVRHLRKLAPRPPRTITEIEVDRDGGLKSLHQTPLDYSQLEDTPLDVNRLVVYTHKKSGANWAGQSIFRPAYRPWAMKDIYLRLDAAAVDKHSSGHWVGKSPDPKRARELTMLLGEMRSAERGVVVLDPNDSAELVGMKGGLVDITPRLNYLDQEMSRSALAMFLDLGHDAGARSLGETMLKIFYVKVQSIAKYMARVATKHIIRDLVRANFPSGTPYPILSPGDIVAQQSASLENLKELKAAGIITYDRGLEDFARARWGAPALLDEEEAEEDTTDLDAALKQAQLRSVNTGAAATAYRTGYDPESIQAAYDLPDALRHTGFYPVTVKTEDAIVEEGTGPRAVAASAAPPRTALDHATDAYRQLMEMVNDG